MRGGKTVTSHQNCRLSSHNHRFPPLNNWLKIEHEIQTAVNLYIPGKSYIVVKSLADAILASDRPHDFPHLMTNADLQAVNLRTLRTRISLCMSYHMKWEKYAGGKSHNTVFINPNPIGRK